MRVSASLGLVGQRFRQQAAWQSVPVASVPSAVRSRRGVPAAAAVIVLTLDAALPGCSAGVVRDGDVVAERHLDGARGHAAALPALAAEVLAEAGIAPEALSVVAVTIGPGSFTGLRAALSLAHGIGAAAGVPVAGVTVGESLDDPADGRLHWAAVDTRRGRMFLDCGGEVLSVALDGLPVPDRPLTVGGDAGAAVAERLAGAGCDVRVGQARPGPAGIAAAALRRAAAGLASRPAQPLYVDPPEARPAA